MVQLRTLIGGSSSAVAFLGAEVILAGGPGGGSDIFSSSGGVSESVFMAPVHRSLPPGGTPAAMQLQRPARGQPSRMFRVSQCGTAGMASDPGNSGLGFSCENLFWKHVNSHLKEERKQITPSEALAFGLAGLLHHLHP